MKKCMPVVWGLLAVAMWGSWAWGDIIRVPLGTTNSKGELIDVAADFQFSNNQLAVTITNEVGAMHSVGQAVRSLSFELSNETSTGWLTGSVGTLRTVNKDGSFTDQPGRGTDWNFNVIGDVFNLVYSAPNETIIGDVGGDGQYSYANSSLAGNGPHNPFLLSGATFYVAMPGVDENTRVRGVVFGLGTGSETYKGISEPQAVPEPASLGLLGAGAVALLWRKRKG